VPHVIQIERRVGIIAPHVTRKGREKHFYKKNLEKPLNLYYIDFVLSAIFSQLVSWIKKIKQFKLTN